MREALEGEGVVETVLVVELVAELSEPFFEAVEDSRVAGVVDVVETFVVDVVETVISVVGFWDENVNETLASVDASEVMIGPSFPPETSVFGVMFSSANLAALT